MARERNRSEAASANGNVTPSKGARVYPAVTPGTPTPVPAQLVPREVALPLFIAALVVLVMAKTLVIRFGVSLLLFSASYLCFARAGARRSAEPKAPRRGVSFDGDALFFQPESGPPRVAVSLREPFGMTLVTSPKRDRIVAVWSSSAGLFYVGTTFLDASGSSRRTLAPLFSRAFTALGDDAALQAMGPDGEPLELWPGDFAALIFGVEELDPACVERIVLSDARGAPLTLDGRELVVGERRFDLDAPLEWRSFVFQEAFGQAVAVYQGTSIRQGASEAVLVSLLPSILPFDESDEGELDRGMVRDLRLMQASPEDPPPRDKRVAIDRLFVLPMRSALDRSKGPSFPFPSTRARA